jgi:hypothetical protein
MRTSHISKRALSGVTLFGALVCNTARAEPTAADKSLATQLFKEGRTLVEQGKVSEGCRKLEESQRLDPGGGTLLNLALCHEKEGRSATAWAEFTEALGIAKKDDRTQRVELAQTHIAALEPTLSRLIIQVPETSDSPELEIKRDGSVIRRAAWGTPMPVDPGEHVVEASGRGKIAWKHTITVGAKTDTKTVVVPSLENAATPPPSAAPAPIGAPSPAPADTRGPNRAPAGWVAIGFGAVGVGVGTYLGLRAMSQQKDADLLCDPDRCSTAAGASHNADAIRSANLATVGFGVGIVGIGVGTYLLLTGGSASSTRSASAPALGASVSQKGVELTLSGRF